MIKNFNRCFVSISGGQTSGYMALKIKDEYPDKDLKFVFANTGQEHEETYKFLDKIEKYYGLPIAWVEALIPKVGKKSYNLVNYDSACRNGSLFDDMINRFGIPNMGYIHCTRELKTEPMYKYIHSEWKKGEYCTAIGIRADEVDRVAKEYKRDNKWYPLAWGDITKKDVDTFWDKQTFKLGIPNFLGNCVWCWKKTYSKHMKIMEIDKSFYDVPKKLEEKYGTCHIETQTKRLGQAQPFFRKNKWTVDLLREFDQNHLNQLSLLDKEEGYENSCKESCEPV